MELSQLSRHILAICLFPSLSLSAGIPYLTGQAETSHSGASAVFVETDVNFLRESNVQSPPADAVELGPDAAHLREKRSYRNYHSSNSWNAGWSTGGGLLVSREPPNSYLKKWLTYEHNRFRRMVPASNMNMLYWSDELAASAQRHADTCDFRHSKGRNNVGENIWAAPYSNYSDAISIWFNEVNNPWCACNHAYKHCCGHYVQVVWAKTSLLGCGFARCRDVQGVWGRGHRNVFVCHYNPQGNTVYVTGNGQLYAVPAFKWSSGSQGRCSDCPESAPACYQVGFVYGSIIISQGLCYMPSNSTSSSSNSAHDFRA